MKYIGEGYYYRVYEFDENKVFKELQSYWFSFRKIYSLTRGKTGHSFIKSIIIAHKSAVGDRKLLSAMKEKQFFGAPISLFANPYFVGNTLNYTQDKVVVMEDFFSKSSLDQNKKAIDGYMEFQKKLWLYGLHDTTYKLQTNYGTDANGNVVCVDFGEFVFTKEKAFESILKKKWLSRQSYKNWKDLELKNYYTERMFAEMTKENLDKMWEKI